MNDLDWSELRSFYLVGKHGSLSKAARAERVSQPTLSRHISRLEEQVGYRLFDRSKAGVTLTQRGAELYEHASAMAALAAKMKTSQSDNTNRLSGTVRLTASKIVATYLLPQILVNFKLLEPGIDVEMVASDETENLHYREADIAIRMFRPNQPDVIIRKVTELQLGIYAAKQYVKRNGFPTTASELLDHDVVGYDRSTLIIEGFKQMGLDVSRDFFKFRSDDQVVCWQMVVSGFGIGFNQRVIGDREPLVQRIEMPFELPAIPAWLTAHAALKTDPKIRRVYDYLGDALNKLISVNSRVPDR